MAMHESSVDYQHLIRDLAEMYPFDVSEVVVVELVANALDAGATRISIDFDPHKKVLIVEDNGKGMSAAEFAQYHDFAASLKVRGTGIGFAGLGAKISFNIADRVITETRSKSFFGGSNWYLQSKKKLVWEDFRPIHLQDSGTRVEVWFRPSTRPSYSSTEDLIGLLRRHYLPLMDSKFLELYERMGLYSSELKFVVNGQLIRPSQVIQDFALDKVREFYPKRARKLFGYGVLGVAATEYPVAPDVCGVLLCTHGKVIKSDLFNQFPGSLGPRLFGMVEIPELIKFLTTSKTDFIRKGKPREFEKLYDPVRQEFKAWLKDIGMEPTEVAGTNEAIRLERELKKILEDVPELAEFFGFWTRTRVLVQSKDGLICAKTQEGIEVTIPVGEGIKGKKPGPASTGEEPGQALVENQKGTEKVRPISRIARRGPKIAFAEMPDQLDLAWVEGNNIVINTGHPSYAKARSNALARRLHCLFAIASAIQRFVGSASEPPDLMFIDRMMAAWGKK